MDVICLAVFIVSSAIHLYASLKQNSKLRGYSKVFIVLSLLGWYFCIANPIKYIVVAALFFSWLGDVLLIPKGVRYFIVGGVSFMASHIFFIMAYYPQIDFGKISPLVIIIAALCYLAVALMVFKGLRPHLKKVLLYPMFCYFMINGIMNCFAFYQMLSMPCTATAIVFVGAMLFFASDAVLFHVRFNKESKIKTHFPVMATYISAEFLIVWGLTML